jgi:serine/threonine protein phosphatase PrpC
MQLRYATSLNQGAEGHLGFDAFHAAPHDKLFVLSDGANGTPLGGDFAQELVRQLALVQEHPWPQVFREGFFVDGDARSPIPKGLGAYLYHLGLKIESHLKESAATVSLAMLENESVRLLGVGDSYAGIFLRQPQTGWKRVHWLARHKDSQGNPSQLIGAPVPIEPHCFQTNLTGDVCVVLATDGAGDFLSEADFTQTLGLIGGEAPSPEDLNFLTQSLCERALRNGSDDDISLCLIWRRS